MAVCVCVHVCVCMHVCVCVCVCVCVVYVCVCAHVCMSVCMWDGDQSLITTGHMTACWPIRRSTYHVILCNNMQSIHTFTCCSLIY